MVNFFLSLEPEGVMEYRVNFYSVWPWKSPQAEAVAQVIQSCTLVPLCFAWSFSLAFFPICLFHVETCVAALEEFVDSSGKLPALMPGKLLRTAVAEYEKLSFATRQFNNHASGLMLRACGIVGLQQTLDAYVVFQLMRMGTGVQEILFLTTDLMVRN